MKPTLNRAPCAKAGIGKTGRDDTAAAPAKPCRKPRRVTSFAPRWSLLMVPSCICARAGWVEVIPTRAKANSFWSFRTGARHVHRLSRLGQCMILGAGWYNVVIRSFGCDILWVDGQFRTSSTGCWGGPELIPELTEATERRAPRLK